MHSRDQFKLTKKTEYYCERHEENTHNEISSQVGDLFFVKADSWKYGVEQEKLLETAKSGSLLQDIAEVTVSKCEKR